MFGSLVGVYVEQMKTGIPYVENAVQTMAQLENKKAQEEAVAFYSSKMRESLMMPVLDDKTFSRCHNECLQQAIELFLSKSVFDKDHEYQKKMMVSWNCDAAGNIFCHSVYCSPLGIVNRLMPH